MFPTQKIFRNPNYARIQLEHFGDQELKKFNTGSWTADMPKTKFIRVVCTLITT